ncbi:MAG: Rho termination factor N-terminal domain-containing protein [Betaproteobacteria bacterium]|nr:Rho termination factor N-terminal domain-containing protein [Betaproteobacteria bacterium]
MTFTFLELKKKTLVEVREIAKDLTPQVQGYTQMNKEHLIEAICKQLNIDMHVHHEVKGIDKGAVKAKIKEWQKKRDEALAAHDRKSLRVALDHIHSFKHQLRKSMV